MLMMDQLTWFLFWTGTFLNCNSWQLSNTNIWLGPATLSIIRRAFLPNASYDNEALPLQTSLGAYYRRNGDVNIQCTHDDYICYSKCHHGKCDVGCPDNVCKSKCNGNHCKAKCKGAQCAADCSGEHCTVKCSGKSCRASCTGELCVSECSGLGCTSTCNGAACSKITDQPKTIEHVARDADVPKKILTIAFDAGWDNL